MSHESLVMSCESIAGRIVGDELVFPDYRTVDTEDVVDEAFDEVVGILSELEKVEGLTAESREQAAHFMGQRFLDNLAYVETMSIADDLAGVLKNVGKPYLVLASIPDSRAL